MRAIVWKTRSESVRVRANDGGLSLEMGLMAARMCSFMAEIRCARARMRAAFFSRGEMAGARRDARCIE